MTLANEVERDGGSVSIDKGRSMIGKARWTKLALVGTIYGETDGELEAFSKCDRLEMGRGEMRTGGGG